MTDETTDVVDSGWDYRAHEGPHRFRPWTVLADHHGAPWLAPGCTCGVIRSAGKPTESEEAMRLWWATHALEAGHESPSYPPAQEACDE